MTSTRPRCSVIRNITLYTNINVFSRDITPRNLHGDKYYYFSDAKKKTRGTNEIT